MTLGTETLCEFGGLDIRYGPGTLSPRSWTTSQSRWAADLAPRVPPGPILELCAGVGQIGLLTIALERRRLVAVDRNPLACEFARRNAEAAGLADLVEVRVGDMGSAIAPWEHFPLILADPPWVPSAEVSRFPGDPVSTIDGGPDGLDVTRGCIAVIEEHLMPGGVALLQTGRMEQAAAIARDLPATLELTERRAFPGRGVLLQLARGRR